jgi:hypothetical protein
MTSYFPPAGMRIALSLAITCKKSRRKRAGKVKGNPFNLINPPIMAGTMATKPVKKRICDPFCQN